VNAGVRALAGLAALVAAALAALLLAACAVAELTLSFEPLSEDGFYALTIARNVAAGRGVTIDGATWTNGFQPLFTFMEAAMFRLGDGDELRYGVLVLALAWAVHLAGALLVGLVARDSRPRPEGRATRFWLAAALYLVAAKNFGDFYTGLETGLQLATIAALWRAAQLGLFGTRGGALGYGLLIGVAILARIDVGFLAVALGLWILVRHWPEAGPRALARPALMAVGAAAVSAPWWLYNRMLFGSFVPSSGTAQQDWAFEPERVREALWALRMVLMPWIFAGPDESLLTDLARVAALVAAALALLANRARADAAHAAVVRQIGLTWGTLLAVGGSSHGESFVARNVGLRSVWRGGAWQVEILFMDHDGLWIDPVDFHPVRALGAAALDERYVLRDLRLLEAIYRPSGKTARRIEGLFHESLAQAWRKTRTALGRHPDLKVLFSRRCVRRLRAWDSVVSGFLRERRGGWQAKARSLGDLPEIEAALEEHSGFLKRTGALYRSTAPLR